MIIGHAVLHAFDFGSSVRIEFLQQRSVYLGLESFHPLQTLKEMFLLGFPDRINCLDEGHLLDAVFVLTMEVRSMVYNVS